MFPSLWFCNIGTNHWTKTFIFYFLGTLFGADQNKFVSPPLLFLVPIDNVKLFVLLVTGIIYKKNTFCSFKLTMTFAHLTFLKTRDNFMMDILISISVLFLLPPPSLPLNQFSNDDSERFLWKKNEVRFGFLVNGEWSEQLSSSQRAGTWSSWRRFLGLQLQRRSWRVVCGERGGSGWCTRVGGQPC